MPVNVDLLRKVRAAIYAEPKRFNMSEWGVFTDGEFVKSCGSTMCIAGWTLALALPFGEPSGRCNVNVNEKAPELLGVTKELLCTCDWPEWTHYKYMNDDEYSIVEFYTALFLIDLILLGDNPWNMLPLRLKDLHESWALKDGFGDER